MNPKTRAIYFETMIYSAEPLGCLLLRVIASRATKPAQKWYQHTLNNPSSRQTMTNVGTELGVIVWLPARTRGYSRKSQSGASARELQQS